MPLLIPGLLLFLATHSVRIFADGWRARTVARIGEKPWKAIIAVLSLASLVLIVVGFGQARMHPHLLYAPGKMLRHLNSLFTLVAMIFIAAAFVPRNHLKAMFGHPMILGVKAWAFGHLLAIGYLRDVLLFGTFLAWAIVAYMAARRRDRVAGVHYPDGSVGGDVIAIIAGVAIWALFAFWLHLKLIGVNPLQ